MNLRSEFPQMSPSGAGSSEHLAEHAFIKPASGTSSQSVREQEDIIDEGCSDVLVNYRGEKASQDDRNARFTAGNSKTRR